MDRFTHIWFADFEFRGAPGERPEPICVVAHELRSGRRLALWQDELRRLTTPPYELGSDSLFVSYYSSAEIGCHLALGWPPPVNVLDLYVEFRNLTNGREVPCGNGLLGALAWFGLDAMAAAEKEEMRTLALRGAPWTADERTALLAYCEADVVALLELWPIMEPYLDLLRALVRGRYMKAAARMENYGVPVDLETLARLRENWNEIKTRIIQRVDADFGVYEEQSFRVDKFAKYLVEQSVPWPRLPSGALALDDDTFKDMARAYPVLAPLRELRIALSQLWLEDLAVGADGRNRCLLSPFRARTGRNQPSNSRFIFGPGVWIRSLIRPEPGTGIAYIDWSQQEFGIAAALSQDPNMRAAYVSGDPYLAFAKQAGAVPASGTKEEYREIRDRFKAVVLAVQYLMGPESLAVRIGRPVCEARELLRLHHETYRTFWKWSDAVVDFALLNSHLFTVFGWTLHIGEKVNPRMLRNFPMQANGAEMLRLACCLATERGVRVVAPVHDALLIEAPLDALDMAVETTQQCMRRASEIVLAGFPLRADAKVVRYPNRYQDPRGTKMWETVWAML
jgi:hypothetical protein